MPIPIMATCRALLCSLAFLWTALPAAAQGPARIDYCRQPAQRSTFIYIDITTPGVPTQQWLQPILASVGFAPREPVALIWFNPANGEGKQLFFDCFPGLTPEEEAALARDPGTQFRSLFVGPGAQGWLRDQRRFLADLAQASALLAGASSGRTGTTATKAVAEFLASERRRFNESAGVPRLIIYSDMAQNSSFASPASSRNIPAEVEQAARRIPNDFGYAEVHVYGADPGFGGAIQPGSREGALAAFWRGYFQRSNAQLKSFDRSLSIRRADPNSPLDPAQLFTWQGGIAHLSGGDQNRYAPAAMQMLLFAHGGRVENAWLSFPGVGAVPIAGTMRCGSTLECAFVGQLEGDLAGALRRGDTFEFSSAADRIQGSIRLNETDLIKVTERMGLSPTEYELAFVRVPERLR